MTRTATSIIIRARLSFPQLFQMRAFGDAVPCYSSLLVVEGADDKTLVAKTLKAVAVEAYGPKKAKEVIAKVKEKQIKDAEYIESKGLPEGSLVFNAKNKKQRPGVVARTANPKTGKAEQITEEMGTTAGGPHEMYGGVECNVALTIYSYSHPTGGDGVAFGLDGLQRWDEGERFGGGRTSPEDLFTFDTPEEVDLSDVLADEDDEDDDPIADIL